MNHPGWKTRAWRVLLASAAVTAAGWYSPTVTAAIWHVFHPRGLVHYRGLSIDVPWPWTTDTDSVNADASASPQGLSLKKTPATLDRRLTNQSIFITVISPDPGKTAREQTEEWLESFRATHPGATFEAAAPTAVPSGARCLSAQSRWAETGILWTCISVEGGWVADFEGRSPDAAVFLEIVRRLKAAK